MSAVTPNRHMTTGKTIHKVMVVENGVARSWCGRIASEDKVSLTIRPVTCKKCKPHCTPESHDR